MSTILQLVQEFCEEQGSEVPSAVIGSTDAGVLQFKRLLTKVGRDIRRRTNWQILSRRIEWNAVGVENQGAITTLLPDNPAHIIPETFWNNTTRQKIVGPISDVEWQKLKAIAGTTAFYRFRVAAGNLLVLGPLTAGDTLTLVYKSNNWLETAAASGIFIDAITADDNVPVFPDELMTLGLMAYWRQAKDLPSDAHFLKFGNAILDAAAVDNVKPVIRMDADEGDKYSTFSGPIGQGDTGALLLE